MLTNELVLARIEQKMPGLVQAHHHDLDGVIVLETARDHIIELLKGLRDDEELYYHFLTSMCAVHYPEQEGRELCMVYHLHNWPQNRRLRVHVYFPVNDPVLPTATNLWPAANWMEREAYDFFGVLFNGHPNLKRILNVEDMNVFPLRKEYRLEDGTRTDKDDRFFGREGNYAVTFD